MEDEIGNTAGKVWDYLKEQGESSPSKIAREIESSQNKAYMAIGWLAREGKLETLEKGRGKTVKLR